ncbi:MAG: hypothetical protein IH818_07665 [Acidobacteria bacterium]|nr:hypothetical protein [Acidobacteriota bacterium]
MMIQNCAAVTVPRWQTPHMEIRQEQAGDEQPIGEVHAETVPGIGSTSMMTVLADLPAGE